MTVEAIFALQINVADYWQAVAFYKSIGMVDEIGYGLREQPDTAAADAALGIDRANIVRSGMLMFPSDPYMHLEIIQWKDAPAAGWPKTYDQLGMGCATLLCNDLDATIAGLKERGQDWFTPEVIEKREWGDTRVIHTRDPEGNHLKLIEVAEFLPAWTARPHRTKLAPDSFGDRRFGLHMQLNVQDRKKMQPFYEALGFVLDKAVFDRPDTPNTGPADADMVKHWGGDHLPVTSYDEAFAPVNMPDTFMKAVTFAGLWRLPGDTNMHLELMCWAPDMLTDPDAGQAPVYAQKGMMRLCMLINNFDSAMADLRDRGVPILIDDVKMYLRWGDTRWAFFHDPEGNILCFESWYPTRYWGERF